MFIKRQKVFFSKFDQFKPYLNEQEKNEFFNNIYTAPTLIKTHSNELYFKKNSWLKSITILKLLI